MKIGDIKVGAEYGALDKPTSRYGTLPRRVTVTAIETVEAGYWTGGGYASTRAKKNVRQLRVRFEDEAQTTGTYSWHKVAAAKKGSELVLEARLLVAPWSELRKDVHERIERKQAEESAKATVEARIKALIPKKMQGDWFYATASQGGRGKGKDVHVEVKLEGRVLDHILTLAEAGKAAS